MPTIALSATVDSSSEEDSGTVELEIRLKVTVGDRLGEQVHLVGPTRGVVLPRDRPLRDLDRHGYRAANPLLVTAMGVTVDPVAPVLRLTWTVRNPTSRSFTFSGNAGGAAAQLLVTPRAEPGPINVAGHADTKIVSELVVDSCDDPSVLQHDALATIRLSLYFENPGVAVLPRAAALCTGAPAVSERTSSVAVSRSGGHLLVVVGAGMTVTGRASWTGSLVNPHWVLSSSSSASVPFVDAIVTPGADGALRLRGTWRPVSCDDLEQLRFQQALWVTLKGTCDYPFLFPFTLVDAGSGCP